MGAIKVRHLVPRRGAYYFQATPEMRKAGIFSEALGNDAAKAVERAKELNASWDRARRGEDVGKIIKPHTIAWLVREYQKTDDYLSLNAKTKRTVDPYMAILEELIGDDNAKAFTPELIKGFRRKIAKSTSNDHAWRLVKELRKLFTLARDKGIRTDNPAFKLRVPGQVAREEVWPKIDLDIFIAVADALGRSSIGTAALLMYDLGQSPIDARTMTWASFVNGGFRFRRSKTSKKAAREGKTIAPIFVPATQRLLARLETCSRETVQIVISEETGRPYKEYDFSHWCNRVRWASDLPDRLKMLDLRRSRVVHLGELGVTVPEIAAVTGHSIDTCTRILEVYLPRTSEMAANAIRKGEAGTKV